MNKYIKINVDKEIIDVFFEFQTNKIDGSEIFLEDTEIIRHKINNKSISNEYGVFIFTWDGTTVSEKTQAQIDAETLETYKIAKRDEIDQYIGANLLKVIKPGIRSLDDIVNQFNQFKTNAPSWTTIEEVDNAFDTAIAWLKS